MTVTAVDETTALIVVDLQRGTLAQQLTRPAEELVANAVALVEAFHARDLPVVLATAQGMPTGRTEYGGGPRQMPPGWDTLAPEIAPKAGDIVLSKHTWSPFVDSDLHARLQELGVTQLVIAGLAASFGIQSTARNAFDLGYDVVVASDAIADVSEAGLEATLRLVLPTMSQLGTTQEIVALIKG